MLTAMTEEDWTIVLRVFAASRARRGDKGRNDRKFLEALHYFVVHNITWRALPEKFGHWNSIWKVLALEPVRNFRSFFDALAAIERDGASGADVRFHHSARPCLGGGRKRGQHGQALGRSRGGFSRPAVAATSRRFSTSAPISIRAPRSVIRATIPNPTA